MQVGGIDFEATNYVAGKWLDGPVNSLDVLHKYEQTSLGHIHQWHDCNLIVDTAQKGHQKLKQLSSGKRRELLENFLLTFQKYENDLGNLVVAEAGKPLNYAKIEVKRCQSTLQDTIEESTRVAGEVVPMNYSIGTGKTAFSKLKPAGIVLAISPFNFPLNLALHKIAPAIAAGCPVILRPSPFTPFSALALAKIAQEAGWDGEFLQVVNTPIEQTQKLVEDKRIRVLSFTGSDRVGWMLRDLARQKSVLLELGGNAALYIDKDTDLKGLAQKIVGAAFLYAGQICISTQRIYIHQSNYDQLLSEILHELKSIKIGDPRIEDNIYGPVIDSAALSRIDSWVKQDCAMGASLLWGGEILDESKNIYAPTLLGNTNREMHIHKDEYFAPVASIESVADADEAFKKINDTQYGLQAGVYTNNTSVLKSAFEQLEVGAVIHNNVPGFRIDNMPYGGVKSSGLGREGARYSIEAYSERTLCIMD